MLLDFLYLQITLVSCGLFFWLIPWPAYYYILYVDHDTHWKGDFKDMIEFIQKMILEDLLENPSRIPNQTVMIYLKCHYKWQMMWYSVRWDATKVTVARDTGTAIQELVTAYLGDTHFASNLELVFFAGKKKLDQLWTRSIWQMVIIWDIALIVVYFVTYMFTIIPLTNAH